MTDQERNKLRVKVAELCGWKVWDSKSVGFVLQSPNGTRWAQFSTEEIAWSANCISDYPNDLNACHEFEETLTRNQRIDYTCLLMEMCKPQMRKFGAIFATAEQRCRAFVATMERKNIMDADSTQKPLSVILDEIEAERQHHLNCVEEDCSNCVLVAKRLPALVKALRRAMKYIEAVGTDSAGEWYSMPERVRNDVAAILNQGRKNEKDLGEAGGQP